MKFDGEWALSHALVWRAGWLESLGLVKLAIIQNTKNTQKNGLVPKKLPSPFVDRDPMCFW
jgi:hypothetical protein